MRSSSRPVLPTTPEDYLRREESGGSAARDFIPIVRSWGRCGKKCGLRDHISRETVRRSSDHYCLISDVGHGGPCAFPEACGRSHPGAGPS